MPKNKLIQLWLLLALIAGFAATLFFIIVYMQESILCDVDCTIKNNVSFALILVALFGVFIGSLTYYLMSEKYEKKIGKIFKDMTATLKFLEPDERAILNAIISNNGQMTQSMLSRKTRLSRVKVSRNLRQLENRQILTRTKKGMTNLITLSPDLKDIFIDFKN